MGRRIHYYIALEGPQGAKARTGEHTPVVVGSARECQQAVVTEAGQEGLWRFDLDGQALVPGSLAPLQGEVVLATSQALLFRLNGRVGERVAFRFLME